MNRAAVVAILGSAQTLAWASSYYIPAILGPSIARETGVSVPTVYAAFSAALLVSAFIGPVSGRLIDRHGGRPVLMATNLVFAAGLTLLGLARSETLLFAAWLVLGVGMGSGLYESAFSTLVRLYGADSRRQITGITLIAGFASTVGWPLSAWMESRFGWSGACFGWAGLHLVLGLPLNALLPRAGPRERARRGDGRGGARAANRRRGSSATARWSRWCSRWAGSSARRWRRTFRASCRRPARRSPLRWRWAR